MMSRDNSRSSHALVSASSGNVRSPNYPAISFAEAITKVKQVYEQEAMYAADKEVVAKAMKYGGLNGASYTMISALTKYGLLESVGEQLRVSADAIDIILNEKGAIERVKAIQKLAFTPTLFNELHEKYPDNSPSDASLRVYLAKRGFNPKAVDGVIRSYRDTIEFVKEETKGSIAESLDELQTEVAMQTPTTRQINTVPSSASVSKDDTLMASQLEKNPNELVLSFIIAEDCKARIIFNGHITQEAIQRLIAHLELSKDVFPKKELQEQELFPYQDE